MTRQSFFLFQLQKIDTRLDQISKRQIEISNMLSDHTSLVQAENEYKSLKEHLDQLTENLSALEKANREKRVKIEQSEASLYSGSVKNPKELTDLQLEIASLRKNLLSIENEQLAIMLEIDTCQKEVLQSQDRVSAEQVKYAEQNSQSLGELSRLQSEISKINAERVAILHQILPDHLLIYEKLRSSKKGIAVAYIDEQSCSICGAELTPSDCQQAKLSQQMTFCPTCGRILYAG